MLRHTERNRNPAWSEQWPGTALEVCLFPLHFKWATTWMSLRGNADKQQKNCHNWTSPDEGTFHGCVDHNVPICLCKQAVSSHCNMQAVYWIGLDLFNDHTCPSGHISRPTCLSYLLSISEQTDQARPYCPGQRANLLSEIASVLGWFKWGIV